MLQMYVEKLNTNIVKLNGVVLLELICCKYTF